MQAKHLSRFMRRTLLPDEKIIKDARFHWMYVFGCFLTLAFCIMMGWAVQYLTYKTIGFVYWQPVLAALMVGCWMWFWMMLKMWTTEIVLTDKRLIYKRGFFRIQADEVDIEQLASDNVVQSILGRMMDYGAVHIRCIEAADFWLPQIAHPYAFRNEVEKQKHAYREHYMHVEHYRRHGGGEAR
jgi:hypothetical protein